MQNIELVRSKLNEVLNHGLVTGVGDPEPGKFCAEAAVCYVLGEPHSDRPSCVADADRSLVIRLNDGFPGTEQERAEALRLILLAHLGTNGKSRVAWARRIAIETVRVILPLALEAAASIHPQEAHALALRCCAKTCTEIPAANAANAAARRVVYDKFIAIVAAAYEEDAKQTE